jgi:hypothetical protein
MQVRTCRQCLIPEILSILVDVHHVVPESHSFSIIVESTPVNLVSWFCIASWNISGVKISTGLDIIRFYSLKTLLLLSQFQLPKCKTHPSLFDGPQTRRRMYDGIS